MAKARERKIVVRPTAPAVVAGSVREVEGELMARAYEGRRFRCPETGRDLTCVDIVKHITALWPTLDERDPRSSGAVKRRAQLLDMSREQREDWARFGVPVSVDEEGV